MCLSTTGFRSQATVNARRSAPSQSFDSNPPTSQQSDLPVDPSLIEPVTRQELVSKLAHRPQTVFDMDLRDLFSDEETAASSLGRLPYLPHQSLQSADVPYQPPTNPNLPGKRESPATSSNPASPQPYQGSGLEGPNAITTAALTAPLSATLPPPNLHPHQNAFSLANHAPYTNFATQIHSQYPLMSPLGDLEFLDSLPLGGDMSAGNHNIGTQAAGSSDFDLGLGMGWDGNISGNQWGDEGMNLDVFEGFFSGWRNGS